MKSRRWIAVLLLLVYALSGISTITVHAKDYTKMEITVCCDGYIEKQTIFEDKYGRKYAPLSWLTYYGSLVMKENDTTYEYHYVGEEKPDSYSRRIFVNKKDNKFSIKIYRAQLMLDPAEYYEWLKSLTSEQWETVLKSGAKNSAQAKDALGMGEDNYIELDNGTFGQKFTYDGKIWVPMDQILPLCGVKVDVDGGRLYIWHDTLSIWQALYKYDIDDVLFDMDEEIWGHEGLSVAGYVVDTGLTLNVFRLDGVFNSGRIMDYEDLFEYYLADNAAYLSAFQNGTSPIDERAEMYRKYFEDVESAWGLYGDILKYVDATKIVELLGREGVDVGDLDLGAEIDGVDLSVNVVKGVLWLYDYWNTYCNQVDDHREMLLTVYDYQIEKEPYLDKAKEMKEWPSYKAAKNITKQYNTSKIDAENKVWDGIMDLLKDEAPGVLATFFSSLKPWTITTSLMKPFLKDEYELVSDAAMLGYVENTLDVAYDTFSECRYKGNRYTREYDEESLNTMRLAGIMTLVVSKYCYEYKNEQLHTEENDEKLAAIQEMLVAYYLAADGLEMDTADYYMEKMKELRDSLNYLTVLFLDDEEESEDTAVSEEDATSMPEDTTTEPEDTVWNGDVTTLDVAGLRNMTLAQAEEAGMKLTVFDAKTNYSYYYTLEKDDVKWYAYYDVGYGEDPDGNACTDLCGIDDNHTKGDLYDGGSEVTVLKGVKTGMTYEEVASKVNVGRLMVYSNGSAWAGQDLGEQGMYDFWFTEMQDGKCVLYRVSYSDIKYHIYEDLDDYFDEEEYKLLDKNVTGLMGLTYGYVSNLPTDVDTSTYDTEIDGVSYTETWCSVYLDDEDMQYEFSYLAKAGETVDSNAYPYQVSLFDAHTADEGWLNYDGGGNKEIRPGIRTGLTCTQLKPLLSSYTYEDAMEIILIEDVGNGQTYTYYFQNFGDNEWDWDEDECILYIATFKDLNRVP